MGVSDMRENQSFSSAYDRLLEIIFDDKENIDMEAIKACRMQMLQSRKKAAVREANDLLKKARHAVCRRDMLIAMNKAIMNEVKAFEASKTQENAVSLMVIVICDAMLKNGPLSEGDDD